MTSQVTPEAEFKRPNLLSSVAYQMVKLEGLQVSQIDMPDFTNTLVTDKRPVVTCCFQWKNS